MNKKHFLLAGLTMAAAFMISACGGDKQKDPFETVTLRQATRGKVVSKGFKYKFVNPKIEALNNHMGVIREGNLLEFISGRSIADKISSLKGGEFSLAVVKEFSPFVHFRVEQIFTATDTTFISQAGAIIYPRIMTEDKLDRSGFEDYNLGKIPYNRTSTIKKLIDKKFYVNAELLRENENGKEVFMLKSKDSKFRIVESGDGTAVILKMLIAGNQSFEGGITLMEMESWPSRKSTHIISNVEVNFVKYGRSFISG